MYNQSSAAPIFFKLCDAVTVEPLVTRYTIPKQRKGADRYGSYEYESGAV